MKKILTFSLLTIMFFSCGKKEDYVYFDNPPPIRVSKKAYPVISLAEKSVDVLWVIDNSGSMAGIQNNIKVNSKLFMQDFIKDKFLNWKMGLISTDLSEDPYVGFRTPLDLTTKDPVTVFSNAVASLGTNGAYDEYVFRNIERMFFDPTWNLFFRADAHLAIIMVTDEEEQSKMPAQDLINFVRANMKTDKILRFYGAFDFGDLPGCSSGWIKYKGSPFEDAINKTGGMVLSACDKQFGKGMAAIGKDIVNFAQTPFIVLNERPVIESIVVSYKGLSIKGGPRHEGGHWYYDEYFNKIYFYGLDFIPEGEEANIDVQFDIFDGRDRG